MKDKCDFNFDDGPVPSATSSSKLLLTIALLVGLLILVLGGGVGWMVFSSVKKEQDNQQVQKDKQMFDLHVEHWNAGRINIRRLQKDLLAIESIQGRDEKARSFSKEMNAQLRTLTQNNNKSLDAAQLLANKHHWHIPQTIPADPNPSSSIMDVVNSIDGGNRK